MNESRFDAVMSRRSLLVRLAGSALAYSGMTAFTRLAPRGPKGPKWDDRFELAVDLEIAPQQGGRWHRPYVAVWVEDAAGTPVRTLTAWLNTSGRGPRYFRELRRWFPLSQSVQSAGGPNLVDTVSSATRMPGKYSLVWNGRDDRGNVVEQGSYRVYIEAAREHGSYQLMQQDVKAGAQPLAASELAGNEEIS